MQRSRPVGSKNIFIPRCASNYAGSPDDYFWDESEPEKKLEPSAPAMPSSFELFRLIEFLPEESL